MVKPTLVSIVALDGRSETTLLALAAGAARGLEPALGAAILDSACDRDVAVAAAECVQATAGAGVVASIGAHRVVVGNTALLVDLGVDLGGIGDWPGRLQRRGQCVLFVAVDGRVAGFIGVADAECKESPLPA